MTVKAVKIAKADMPKKLPKGMTIQITDGYVRFACDGSEVASAIEAFAEPMSIADFNKRFVTPCALALTYALAESSARHKLDKES